jgi:hypothetical protein
MRNLKKIINKNLINLNNKIIEFKLNSNVGYTTYNNIQLSGVINNELIITTKDIKLINKINRQRFGGEKIDIKYLNYTLYGCFCKSINFSQEFDDFSNTEYVLNIDYYVVE